MNTKLTNLLIFLLVGQPGEAFLIQLDKGDQGESGLPGIDGLPGRDGVPGKEK